MPVRLDKFLAGAGAFSRREAGRLIREGRVTIDSAPAASPDMKLEPSSCRVLLDGRELFFSEHRYFMLNKPRGVLSATEDASAKTVLDLLEPGLGRLGLFPVGRLDKDTEGLLILTNDGAFAHRITSPKSGVGKLYEVVTDGALGPGDVRALREGVRLGDGTLCLPAELTLPRDGISPAVIEICEGKYHQVKRMMASVGKPVLSLRRIRIGGLWLDGSLAPGEYREMSQGEAFLSKSAK